MDLEGVERGGRLESWRAFDISGGERFPIRWMLTDAQEEQCEIWLNDHIHKEE